MDRIDHVVIKMSRMFIYQKQQNDSNMLFKITSSLNQSLLDGGVYL